MWGFKVFRDESSEKKVVELIEVRCAGVSPARTGGGWDLAGGR